MVQYPLKLPVFAEQFVDFGSSIVPQRSPRGDGVERVDPRVLQVLYRFTRSGVPVFVGQLMAVYSGA